MCLWSVAAGGVGKLAQRRHGRCSCCCCGCAQKEDNFISYVPSIVRRYHDSTACERVRCSYHHRRYSTCFFATTFCLLQYILHRVARQTPILFHVCLDFSSPPPPQEKDKKEVESLVAFRGDTCCCCTVIFRLQIRQQRPATTILSWSPSTFCCPAGQRTSPRERHTLRASCGTHLVPGRNNTYLRASNWTDCCFEANVQYYPRGVVCRFRRNIIKAGGARGKGVMWVECGGCCIRTTFEVRNQQGIHDRIHRDDMPTYQVHPPNASNCVQWSLVFQSRDPASG